MDAVEPIAAQPAACAGRIADAVLYEGYILWPYRKSALKNQHRFTFGGVYPPEWSAARGGDDPSSMQTQCLIEGPDDAVVDVRVRCLHVVDRQVMRRGEAGLEAVEELEVAVERHVSWQEAVEREALAEGMGLAELEAGCRVALNVLAGAREEELRDAAGAPVGALVRSWRALDGTADVVAERLGPGLWRLTVRIENAGRGGASSRDEALLRTLCSTHTILATRGGSFVSQTDPPEHLRAAAGGCVNTGTWPVLVGDEGDRRTVLSSPIILPDHPQVAPESPGDLFDATEIDQMLVLNILSMTEEERRDMRDSDPRAREILERTEALTEEQLMRLHGAVRELSPVRRR